MKADVETIKLWFDYDAIHGLLLRKLKTRSDALDVIPPEREKIRFMGREYDYATLCWVVYYGKFPNGIVDHKNRIRADHEINNLRDATPTQNQQNKAGYGQYSKGVTWRDRKVRPWQAKIRVNGDRIHLGSFETEEEAAEAYRQAAIQYHGEFACTE